MTAAAPRLGVPPGVRPVVAIPFALTFALGAIGITRQAWRDEHATWWASTIPFDDFLRLVSHVDIVLAPYYLLMRLWITVFGDSVIAMRVPSLLAMAVAASLTAALGAKLFTPNIGLAAGCLLAVIPSVSRYAEEARPYAFALCFAVASMLALVSRRWILLGLFVALTGLSHLIALLVLLAHLPLVSSWKRWFVAVGLGLVPLLPLAWLGSQQTGQVAWISASLKSFATLPQSLTRSAATAGILAALGLVALVSVPWSRSLTALLVWAAGPPLVLFVFMHSLFYYRYLLFTLPAWALLAASAVRLVPVPRQRLAAAALCLAVLALGARDHIGLRKSPLPGDQDYAAAASFVHTHARSTDRIVFAGFPDQRERFGFAYEWRRTPSPVTTCPVLETCAASRIWLVTTTPPASPALPAAPASPAVPAPPAPAFTASLTRPFSGLTITLLELASR
ncbi:glycosyltransferase family 39 protein [Catelliglobosispora koreensis]|uniref:glycosyltransferase family 39 protein n=1 Tax=Catelliglobosispora koreensis TaxID=129052 RepID=UPI00036C27F5|nr:glycosyltransferase family 39 protein [Catelliglobosispora koreensis]